MVGFTLFQKKLDRLKNYIKISFIEMILIFIFFIVLLFYSRNFDKKFKVYLFLRYFLWLWFKKK
jgi:hypothetical protein